MKYPIICFYKGNGIAWLRIKGYGIHIKNTEKRPLLFSDRYNNRLILGKYIIKTLTP